MLEKYNFLLPLLVYVGLLCFAILVFPIGKKGKTISHFLLIAAVLSFVILLNRESSYALTDLFLLNPYKIKFVSIVSFFALLVFILNGEKEKKDVQNSLLSAFMLLGSIFLIGSTEFMTFFVCLEIIGLMGYGQVALSGMENSKEAAIKYFIQGSIFSAFFLLGVAFFVGATGGFNFLEFKVLNQELYVMSVAILFLVGCFKLGAFPFHAWMPDVYSNVNRGNLASSFLISKLVVGYTYISVLIRLVNFADPRLQVYLVYGILVIAVLSAFYGNIMGLAQMQFKRIVAYSSLAHAGYMLMTLCLTMEEGYEEQLMFYLTFYSVSATGALLLLNKLLETGNKKDFYDSLKGAFYKDSFSSFLLCLFVLSLAGIPLTSGFTTKYLLFTNYFREGLGLEATAILISTIIGLGYYVRFVIVMFMEEPEEKPVIVVDLRDQVIHVLLAFLVILGGISPSLFLR